MTAEADTATHPGEPPQAVTTAARQALDVADLTGSLREPERFTAIYDRHFTAVYRYVAGRLGPQVADDLAAETFLTAFRKRDAFDSRRGALRPWLFGIATNLVAQHKRDETRRYRALARAGAEPYATPGHEDRVVRLVTAEGMQPRLARALAKLSQAERDVVLLVALSGLAHDEVAQALDIPYGTVGSRLSRARKKLRAALDLEVPTR
jgi:RNA polymerase sigma factor (sigma-70 family)